MTFLTVSAPTLIEPARSSHLVAIASGKGGVGKTWLAITLAHALARAGARTLLFDGDLGLANVDVQLGLMPPRDLGGVLDGPLPLADAVTPYASGGFDVIAGHSGSGLLANQPRERLTCLIDRLRTVAEGYDHVILDLGAGLDRSVRQLSLAADTCIVVLTNEPTSLTDAYAFIKVRQRDGGAGPIDVVVNMAASAREGQTAFKALQKACESFLKFSPTLLGIVRQDTKVRESIRNQMSILCRYPNACAALDVEGIAARLAARAACTFTASTAGA
jgi:flagellar biosynthesis protein FlhG